MKISFKLPIEKDIIVFDKECSDEIVENVFKENYKYSILDNRSYLIYLNPLFIMRYIYLLIKNLNFKVKITRQLFYIYFLNILEHIKPKVVITYIDNNNIYLWLAQNYKKCDFIAIQNGVRQNFENSTYKDICKHDHFYCFGNYDIKKHTDLGCTINKGYSVGSLRAGLLLSNSKLNKKKYDLCIISSDGRRDPNIIKEIGIKNIAINNRKIDSVLKKYIIENNLKLVIALSTNSKSEKEYYRSIFGQDVVLRERSKPLSTYETINQSRVSVSFMSSLILEAIGLGNKALSIHFNNTDLYFDYPNEIKYLYKDYTLFNKYMNDLLGMTEREYSNKIKTIKEYVMNNDALNPPHQIIKNHIDSIIRTRV